jgi:hypothetical protein
LDFGEWKHRFGHADEMCRLLRGDRNRQRPRIGQADVLAGQNDQATRDEHQVLAGLEHARQPVQGCIRIGAAHGFDEGTDGVVMRIAGLVVDEQPLLDGVLDQRQAQDVAARRHSRVRGELQRVQCCTAVAVGAFDEVSQRGVLDLDASPAETPF